jgi:transcriptional regulator with XRE-family HTH domain
VSFYDNLKSLCDERGVSITKTVELCGGSTGSIGGWKAGKWPNSEIVFKIATRLDVSCDRLLLGRETEKVPVPGISENGREMLELYEKLPEREQILLLGRLQEMTAPLLGETKKRDQAEAASSGGRAG